MTRDRQVEATLYSPGYPADVALGAVVRLPEVGTEVRVSGVLTARHRLSGRWMLAVATFAEVVTVAVADADLLWVRR